MAGKRLTTIVTIAFTLNFAMMGGCNEDDGDSGNVGNNPNTTQDWLQRSPVPDSPYKPAALEAAVNAIVSALNETEQDNTIKLGFIPKDQTDYFDKTVEGANDAFAELGVVHTVVAPEVGMAVEEARVAQIGMVQDQIQGGYAGFGLASMATDLITYIDQAVDAGMTVVTFDSDEPTSKRQLYVGTINTEAGKTGGESMVTALAGATGTVLILGNTDESWTGGLQRTNSAKAVIEAAGNTVAVHHSDWVDQNINEAALQELMTTSEPPVVGCLGVFSNSYLCATAADNVGMADAIKVVAFDFETQTQQLMQEGKIESTHVQRQYYMGYLIPYIVYASKALGLGRTLALVPNIMVDAQTIDTGLDVIPHDGIEEYNAFLTTLSL